MVLRTLPFPLGPFHRPALAREGGRESENERARRRLSQRIRRRERPDERRRIRPEHVLEIQRP